MTAQSKEKLYQMMVYFVKHTQYCNRVKLLALMQLTDSECYKQTGKHLSFENDNHFIVMCWHIIGEVLKPSKKFKQYFNIIHSQSLHNYFHAIELKQDVTVDINLFTRDEYRIMQELAIQYTDANEKEVVNANKTNAQDKSYLDLFFI